VEIHGTEKSVGPPTARRKLQIETESEPETEIEFVPVTATSVVGPFEHIIYC